MDSMDAMEVTQSVVIAGHKLEIIATPICEGEWALCIENIHRIRTNWCVFFATPEAALEAGRRALETEGIEDFVSDEGFEYLR